MARFGTLILLAQWLALAAATVYTGFSYGAFWSPAEGKNKADFLRQFKLARTLPNTPVPFNSARLFTCIQWGTEKTTQDPIQAFDAAIETNTSLLLGFWAPDEASVENELIALGKAFKKYGQQLSDLVVGLSVGNEDIYRFTINDPLPGASADEVKSLAQLVRAKISNSSFASFWKDKPIGHTDIQDFVLHEGMDFVGMNTYPYWAQQPIERANDTFFNTFADARNRAGSTEVWVTETGWPFAGDRSGAAIPSKENMQKYWSEVGCSLFGKHNTWWFELEKDSPDGPDWGIIDIESQKPRIDLSCPAASNSINGTPPTAPSLQASDDNPLSSSFITLPSPSTSIMEQTSTGSIQPTSSLPLPTQMAEPDKTSDLAATQTSDFGRLTIYTAETVYVTPTGQPPDEVTFTDTHSTAMVTIYSCVTVADVRGDGHLVPVATNTPLSGTNCASPPSFTGMPYATTQPNPLTRTSSTLTSPYLNSSSSLIIPSIVRPTAPLRPTSVLPPPPQSSSAPKSTKTVVIATETVVSQFTTYTYDPLKTPLSTGSLKHPQSTMAFETPYAVVLPPFTAYN